MTTSTRMRTTTFPRPTTKSRIGVSFCRPSGDSNRALSVPGCIGSLWVGPRTRNCPTLVLVPIYGNWHSVWNICGSMPAVTTTTTGSKDKVLIMTKSSNSSRSSSNRMPVVRTINNTSCAKSFVTCIAVVHRYGRWNRSCKKPPKV